MKDANEKRARKQEHVEARVEMKRDAFEAEIGKVIGALDQARANIERHLQRWKSGEMWAYGRPMSALTLVELVQRELVAELLPNARLSLRVALEADNAAATASREWDQVNG
jgi:hypothetical protein